MRIFKRLVLLLVVLIVVAIIYVAMHPSEYKVTRTKVINAPVASVYNTVNDLTTWESWGSWYEKDTTIKVTYGDVTSGAGAYYSWTSKDGPGKMTTTAVVANQSINQELQFADYDPSGVRWTFEEVDGGTSVTWIMEEDEAPFSFKIFAAMMGGWEGMLAPDMEAGLENLDSLMVIKVKEENSFRMDDVQSVELEKSKFIGYFHKVSTDIDQPSMQKLYMESMPKVHNWATKNGLKEGEFTPGSVYTKWDEETKEAEFYIGFKLHDKMIKLDSGMEKVDLPGGKGVMVRKYGQYGNGDMEAHVKIGAYLAANKLEPTGLVWELFTNDPGEIKPQDIQTDIYYSVK